MKKLAVVGITVLASLVIATSVFATTFVNPPETNAPAWGTSYPYQRNIYWDFSSDPVATTDQTYAGTYDPSLQISDDVTFAGDVQWYSSISGYSRSGLIGIDNRGGTSTLTGTVTFHIANLPENNPIKHIWEEIEYYEHDFIDPISTVSTSLVLNSGYTVDMGWDNSEGLSDGFDRYNIWYEISPNPYCEEIVFEFSVEPETYAVIDSFHIATECIPIPEPATMILLGSLATGLFGVAGIRRKK
jgi:hypothetical protein